MPPGADAYLLSRVLQDWDDESCITLLSTCRRAMSPGARLLILERVLPATIVAGQVDLLPVPWDLHLLTVAGGRHRTLDGYRSLLAGAGLRLTDVHALALGMNILVAAVDPVLRG